MAEFNLAEQITEFEEGSLTDTQIFELFQHMIDDGTAWKLQGSYGRTAARLIMFGKILWGPEAQASYEREFVPPEDNLFRDNLHHHARLHAVAGEG